MKPKNYLVAGRMRSSERQRQYDIWRSTIHITLIAKYVEMQWRGVETSQTVESSEKKPQYAREKW